VTSNYAQDGIKKTSYNKDNVITFRTYDTKVKKIDESKSKETIKDLLEAKEDDDLIELKSMHDELGYTHHFFQQTYKGINVENGMYITHAKDGLLESVNGDFFEVGNVNTIIKYSESEALSKALEYIGAQTYAWQIKEEEQFIKEVNRDNDATFYPKGEKVIAYNVVTNTYRLAYKFNIYAHYPLSRNNVYIDAITGDLIGKQNLICDSNVTGTAETRYSGPRTISTEYITPTYRLGELTNSVRIETKNMRAGINWNVAPYFADNDNNWTATEYQTNLDDAGLDAHWGAEKVHAYWNTVRLVNSWNGMGAPLLNYVHADLHAMNPSWFSDNDNAFWDGARMFYGDGQTINNPLVSLDIVAHELGHGFRDGVKFMRSPNLSTNILSSGNEALALNEGLSDIWAACVENWAAPEKQCWQNGEETMKNGFSCIRSLRSPKTEGFLTGYTTEGNYPDTYGGTFWYTGTNSSAFVHINSTVLSHWFYLVSMGSGGNHVNDLGNTYNVIGIGISDAASIVWRAERDKFTATTNYSSACDLIIQAATELFGTNSCQVKAVKDAWFAVGVGSAASQMSINGSSPVCSSGSSTFTIENWPYNTAVTWSKSSNLILTSQTNNKATFTSIGNGIGFVYATVYPGSSCQTILPQYPVWVGTPITSVSSISNLQDMGYSNYYKILPSSGNYPYEGTLYASADGGEGWSFSSNIPKKNIIYW